MYSVYAKRKLPFPGANTFPNGEDFLLLLLRVAAAVRGRAGAGVGVLPRAGDTPDHRR